MRRTRRSFGPPPAATRRRGRWSRRRGGRWAPVLAVVSVAYVGALLTLVIHGFIIGGLRLDAQRNAPEARVVVMRVTGIRTYCYKGCSYESIGNYIDPVTGQLVTGVSATPSFSEPAFGPLRVIVSPTHRLDAIRADYTGTGAIAAGVTIVVLALIGPLLIVLLIARLLLRRARVRNTLRAVAAGAEPTGRFDGILRGPGIPSVIGVSSIELTPTELVEYEHHLGGSARWRVALTEVMGVQEIASQSTGVPHPSWWRSLSFHTSSGEYTLSCDPAYGPLLQEAFTRHASSAAAGERTDAHAETL